MCVFTDTGTDSYSLHVVYEGNRQLPLTKSSPQHTQTHTCMNMINAMPMVLRKCSMRFCGYAQAAGGIFSGHTCAAQATQPKCKSL